MAEDSDRTIPATPRRRDMARRAGLGAPADLPAWAATAATAILLAPAWARTTIPAAADAFREAAAGALSGRGLQADSPWALPVAVVLPTLGLIAASAAAGLAVRLACDGPTWRPGRAAPDLARIDPRAGLRRIFSRATVARVAGGTATLALLMLAAAYAVRPLLAEQAAPVPPDEVGGLAAAGWRAAAWVTAAAAAAAACQWILARRRFERQVRMTPQEFAEERKDLQADPRVRLLQRERRQSAAASGTA